MASTETIFTRKNQSDPSLQLNDDAADITFWCDDHSIRAHKRVLISASPYFDKIFASTSHESSAVSVILVGLDYAGLVDVLTFIYEGNIALPFDRLELFKKAAVALKIVLGSDSDPANQNDLKAGENSSKDGEPEDAGDGNEAIGRGNGMY